MTTEDVINGILARKSELNVTNAQIADASQVPKTTVDRILRGETQNPSFQVILDIATAVGFEFGHKSPEPIQTDDAALQQIIYVYEKRCEALEKESRLKTVQYNMAMAEKDRIIETKDRWVNRLFDSLVILAVGVMVVLLIDVCVRGIGWLP